MLTRPLGDSAARGQKPLHLARACDQIRVPPSFERVRYVGLRRCLGHCLPDASSQIQLEVIIIQQCWPRKYCLAIFVCAVFVLFLDSSFFSFHLAPHTVEVVVINPAFLPIKRGIPIISCLRYTLNPLCSLSCWQRSLKLGALHPRLPSLPGILTQKSERRRRRRQSIVQLA
jgi:hypothetical protein